MICDRGGVPIALERVDLRFGNVASRVISPASPTSEQCSNGGPDRADDANLRHQHRLARNGNRVAYHRQEDLVQCHDVFAPVPAVSARCSPRGRDQTLVFPVAQRLRRDAVSLHEVTDGHDVV